MDFIDLPVDVHQHILRYVGSADPSTRFRYARTCRFLWRMTEESTENKSKYEVRFMRDVVEIHGNLFNGFLTRNARTQALLLSGLTVERLVIQDPPVNPFPVGLKAWNLSIRAGYDGRYPIDLPWLQSMKPPGRKYDSLNFWGYLAPAPPIDFLEYASTNVDVMMMGTNLDQEMYLAFKGANFRMDVSRQEFCKVPRFLDAMLAQWMDGEREINEIRISGGPGYPGIGEHVRSDGTRLRVDWQFGEYFLLKIDR